MIDRFRENLSAHWRETIGFALFLAWVHCALFGCGLSSAKEPIACVPTTYHLEHIWLTCGLFKALGGIAGMLIARKLPGVDRLLHVLAVLRHPPHEGKRPRRAFARGRHVLRLHAPCARRRCMPSL